MYVRAKTKVVPPMNAFPQLPILSFEVAQKALEEHFLMVPLVFQFVFWVKMHFLNSSQKISVFELKMKSSHCFIAKQNG
jgi:hypothetical protein